MMMKRTLIFLCMILGLAQIRAAAWGGYEHTIAAYIAQDHLTANAARNISHYLDQPIYEYAEWMDFKPVVRRPGFDIARNGHSTAVDFDGTIPEITPFENGNGKGSCYRYLKEILNTFENHRNLPDSLVIYHLRCFLHMIGDFHCPVHIHFFNIPKDGTSLPNSMYLTSEAATPIVYNGKKTDLHKLLDSSLMHIHDDWTYERWRIELDTYNQKQIGAAVEGDLESYLKGNCRVSREIYDNVQEGIRLDNTYFAGHMKELIYQQIRLAAYRMAKILNDYFDYED